MKHKIDPKSIAKLSYATLMGYERHEGPPKRIPWPVHAGFLNHAGGLRRHL